MPQAIFDDAVGFKVKEKVIKVEPKKSENIKDISIEELRGFCFYNHCNICHWLVSDLQPCVDICYGWLSMNPKIVKKFRKKSNKYMVHILDIVDKVECLKGFRAVKEKMDGRKIMQMRIGME